MMMIGLPAKDVQIHDKAAKLVVRVIAIKMIALYHQHRHHPHLHVHVVNRAQRRAKHHVKRQIVERKILTP